MPGYTRKYSNRLFISSISALVIHAVLFLVLQLVFHINLFSKPEYPETIYVSLVNTPNISSVTETAQGNQEIVASKSKTDEKSAELKSGKTTQLKGTEKTRTESASSKSKQPATNNSIGKDIGETASSGEGNEKTTEKSGSSIEPSPTARKSSLDEGNLSGLDQLLGSNGGSGETSSANKEGGNKSGTKTSSGKNASGNIQWEDSSTRAALSAPQPKIPAWVEKQGLRLFASISFVLTADGFLRDIHVERSTGYTEVDIALTDALRLYKFDPRKNAKNVSGKISFLIDYK